LKEHLLMQGSILNAGSLKSRNVKLAVKFVVHI